ncbi:MAG TPA: SRPBCC family protein [Propionibacteriaceae bacterium]
MSVRLQVSTHIRAEPQAVWDVLVDWPGQSRWIPLTTVEVVGDHDSGVGVRVEALSGFWLGPLPVGLLDRFVVTGWTPPADGAAELEVLHLGPYFTGEGVFALQGDADGTTVTATEMINLPAAALTETVVRQTLPLMRVAFGSALRALGRLAEQG